MSLTTHPGQMHAKHYWHDQNHGDGDGDSCPSCRGWMIACSDCTQAPSGGKTATHSSGTGGADAGQEVEPRSPEAPSRPVVHPTQRVTWDNPLTVDQDVHDDSWTVTVHLTEEARRQLARDLVQRHMADLVLLRRLTTMEKDNRRAGLEGSAINAAREAHTVESRLAGAMQALATTQWVHTPLQVETLTEDLDDANAEPETCAVDTCSGFATNGGSYCAPHTDGV